VREPAEGERFEVANGDLTRIALAVGKLQASQSQFRSALPLGPPSRTASLVA